MRLSAKFDKILNLTLPLESFSTCGAIYSAIVLTVLAPIASRTSTSKCTINIGPTVVSAKTWTSISSQPPPRPTKVLSFSFAAEISSFLCSKILFLADCKSCTPMTCICARITGRSAYALKPPFARANLAIKDAAATTEGSSTAIGIK